MSEKTSRQEPCARYRTRPATFVLCRSCFWCASLVGGDLQSCPTCSGRTLDCIPVFEKERYRLKFWRNGNVELDFAVA